MYLKIITLICFILIVSLYAQTSTETQDSGKDELLQSPEDESIDKRGGGRAFHFNNPYPLSDSIYKRGGGHAFVKKGGGRAFLKRGGARNFMPSYMSDMYMYPNEKRIYDNYPYYFYDSQLKRGGGRAFQFNDYLMQ